MASYTECSIRCVHAPVVTTHTAAQFVELLKKGPIMNPNKLWLTRDKANTGLYSIFAGLCPQRDSNGYWTTSADKGNSKCLLLVTIHPDKLPVDDSLLLAKGYHREIKIIGIYHGKDKSIEDSTGIVSIQTGTETDQKGE